MDSVKITNAEYSDTDEWYGEIFKCPACGEAHLWKDFKYCPDCGIKVEWDLMEWDDWMIMKRRNGEATCTCADCTDLCKSRVVWNSCAKSTGHDCPENCSKYYTECGDKPGKRDADDEAD